jgi:hypothetical protein
MKICVCQWFFTIVWTGFSEFIKQWVGKVDILWKNSQTGLFLKGTIASSR